MLLFLHGAGGVDDDAPLAQALAWALGTDLAMPPLPESDMSFPTWAAPIREAIAQVTPTDVVIAHSFAGSILLKVVAETPLDRATLLGVPDWGPAGWDVEEYRFHGPEPTTALSLHHCRDDAVVPFEHLARLSAQLPSAQVHTYDTGGHQFEGRLEEIAATTRAS